MVSEMLRCFPNKNLVGKAFDLKSAYRQFAVSPESSWASYVAMWDSENSKPSIFRLRALPFGASKSVYSFLRVAHSLWWIAIKALRVAWTYYFDDFVCVSCDEVAKRTDHCICAYFHLLGWAFATEGEKFSPFSSSFQALGVKVDLGGCLSGCLSICNTESRIAELTHALQLVISEGRLDKALALKLRVWPRRKTLSTCDN